MRANFDECRRRLDGAEADRQALVGEFAAFVQKHGQLITVRPLPHKKDRNIAVATVIEMVPVPKHWDRRVAHILYDTRSALDHLVHELYVASTGKRPSGKVAGALEFPICDSEGAWTNAVADTNKHISKLHRLSDAPVRIIWRHQPYRSRKTALKRLRRFNDFDKHRRPNVVLFAVREATIRADDGPGCRVDSVELRPAIRRALKVNAQLAYVYVTPTNPTAQPCVGVGFDGELYFALTRGIGVEDLLFKTMLEARSIVEACAALA